MSHPDLPFWNPDLPLQERVDDLVSRMTLEEKIGQTLYQSPAIDRLGVPEYNWWNECLHGVGRAGIATVFPQSIGLAATFNQELIHQSARIISDEARAKHHEFNRRGDHRIYKGLTFWTPNVNIFRDPRWGRGQETYGEDPFLTGRMGVAFVRGLQGEDPHYLKLVATPKHYAVHSGPEPLRHHFDAVVSPKDLRETYLPHFKECVQEGGAWSVMGAYNRTNGEACCASPTLLQKILREEWGFQGYIVSDCGAIADIHAHHKLTADAAEAAALAVNNGCDLNCGQTYRALVDAVERGIISEETINRAVGRLMEARFRLGMFDPEDRVPYARIPYKIVDCGEHREKSLQAARESLVLLKNENILPLLETIETVAVVGPLAHDREVLIGNYAGTPAEPVTLLDGLRARTSEHTTVVYAHGCTILDRHTRWGEAGDDGFTEAEAAAESADVVVVALGLTASLEGEEGAAEWADAGGDRPRIDLPDIQQRFLRAMVAVGKPVVLVLFSGSPLSVPWEHENVAAIVQAWYPGGTGGQAVAELLYGNFSPAGRMPITVVHQMDDLPPFEDYRLTGRTYRYLDKEPLYPFGYGLSYSRFQYGSLTLSADRIGPDETLTATVVVRNVGDRASDEVVQLYLTDLEASVVMPHWSLRGFRRIHLKPGEETEVRFELSPRQLALIDDAGRAMIEPGMFRLHAGGSQPDQRSRVLGAAETVSVEFAVEGEATEVPY